MEQQVTIPVERALNTVPGVISKRSRTIFGLSKVSLIFNDRIDLYLARQLVLEKLRKAELPEGANVLVTLLSEDENRFWLAAGEPARAPGEP